MQGCWSLLLLFLASWGLVFRRYGQRWLELSRVSCFIYKLGCDTYIILSGWPSGPYFDLFDLCIHPRHWKHHFWSHLSSFTQVQHYARSCWSLRFEQLCVFISLACRLEIPLTKKFQGILLVYTATTIIAGGATGLLFKGRWRSKSFFWWYGESICKNIDFESVADMHVLVLIEFKFLINRARIYWIDNFSNKYNERLTIADLISEGEMGRHEILLLPSLNSQFFNVKCLLRKHNIPITAF